MRISAYLIIVITLLFISSCKDDEPIFITEDLYGKWEAISFFSVESETYEKKDDFNPKITFFETGIYGIDLDINGCGAHFTISGENNIEIESPICTNIWPDSEFSEKFSNIIDEVSTFEFEKNGDLRLNIDDWGYILLQKVE